MQTFHGTADSLPCNTKPTDPPPCMTNLVSVMYHLFNTGENIANKIRSGQDDLAEMGQFSACVNVYDMNHSSTSGRQPYS